MSSRHYGLAAASLLLLLTAEQQVAADIIGLQAGSYEFNTGDSGAPPIVDNDFIQITSGNGQRRSLFFGERQQITAFTATFTYRATNVRACLNWQGAAFIIQNDARGVDALGGALGFAGVSPSGIVTIQMDTGPGRTYSGLYFGGVLGSGAQPISPVNAFDAREIDVTIVYSRPTLRVTMDNRVDAPVESSYLVSALESQVGGTHAYIGFSAGTGDGFGNGGANQYLSNFRFYEDRECRADYDGNGDLNSQDFFAFLAGFFVSAPECDFNRDGTVGSQDFFDFLTAFFAGCD